jgi:hypothetical protein
VEKLVRQLLTKRVGRRLARKPRMTTSDAHIILKKQDPWLRSRVTRLGQIYDCILFKNILLPIAFVSPCCWNSWIQLRLQKESFEQFFLNECISSVGHGFYTWQWENRHRHRKWYQDLLTGWNCLDVNFKRGTWWPYITMYVTDPYPFNTQTMHIKSFYTQQHCYESLKTLYPGGIWARVFLFLRQLGCPLRHAARARAIAFFGRFLKIRDVDQILGLLLF